MLAEHHKQKDRDRLPRSGIREQTTVPEREFR